MVGAHQLLPHEEYGRHICTDTAPYQDPACVPVIIYDIVCQGQRSISEASSRAEKGGPTPGPIEQSQVWHAISHPSVMHPGSMLHDGQERYSQRA